MEQWWLTLLREQQRQHFADVAGTQASITLPLSDRLISRILAARIPASVLTEFDLVAHAGNQLTVRVRLAKPSFLPSIQLRFAIEQQPDLPTSPVVALAMVSQHGMAAFAANALNFVNVLPAGVVFDGRRFVVNIATLLERHDAAGVLEYLTDLKITTLEHQVVVRAQAAVP
ncbi:MAG TPA: hypothetical protein VM165_13975 [Planctomycetaceae bacterium]|nr:hypothetical protein [Planctomycetaceae bacterium]